MEKKKKGIIAGIIAVESLIGALWIKSAMSPGELVTAVERSKPGTGETEMSMEVWVDERFIPITIEVGEKIYTNEELEKVFEEGKKWLDTVWLGSNEKAEWVTENLYFPTQIQNIGLTVEWLPESFRWIRSDGTITDEARRSAPLETSVRAVLHYGEEERGYDYVVTIGGPVLEGEAAEIQAVHEAVEEFQESSRTENRLILPESVGGKTVKWYLPRESPWSKIFILGNLGMALLFMRKKENQLQKLKAREMGLNRDYPDVVYRMILLIGSGMTVRSAWEKMILDYQEWCQNTGKVRWGYEEMMIAQREMNYGVSELKAYENFGRRCGTQNYIRFASLLIQQIRRGAKGMNQLLAQEVGEAEIIRRENARKMAEEAGTKLLFPMVLLMTVVFAMLIVPAFLSMNI
ncbi:MAG: type II secretion system F family protein [Clostridia bacterium]|nr:hypothetical protein [Lachnospiraceae bacterium]NCB99643.1 type II secretion system F family protein [Clostridia bacterium]NCD01847.1 type II secretion system F family protein [Clostridia bacterium]